MPSDAVHGPNNRTYSGLGLITSQAFSIANFRGQLVQEVMARGDRVLALAPDYDESTRARVSALGAEPVSIALERTAISPVRDLVDLLRLVGTLRSRRPAATLAYFIKPVIYGTLAAWLAGVPRRYCLIEGAGYVFSESVRLSWRGRLLRRVVSWQYRLALSRADKVFFLNADDMTLFATEGLVDPSKSRLLGPIGVDLDAFAPAPAVSDPVVFMLIARLLKEKGVREFVEAARQVKAIHPTARFVLVGDRDLNPNSLDASEVRGWVEEGVVEWPGRVPDVRPWLAQASVFVLPSYYREGVPRGIQEAMAMGRPVITTDIAGCRETVVSGHNGLIVPPRDVMALVAALLRFIEAPDLIIEMGRESRLLAEERFDVRRINAFLLDEMGWHG